MPNPAERKYPALTRFVKSDGWIEIGADHYSQSFIRVLNEGGLIWKGETEYPSLDAALAAGEAAVIEWRRDGLGER